MLSWCCGLPHNFIQRRHFSRLRCGLGKGKKYTPSPSLSGYFVSELHVPHEHCLTIFKLQISENWLSAMHFNGRAGRESQSVWEWLHALWLAHRVWGRDLAIGQILVQLVLIEIYLASFVDCSNVLRNSLQSFVFGGEFGLIITPNEFLYIIYRLLHKLAPSSKIYSVWIL